MRQESISNHNDHRPQYHSDEKLGMNDSLLLAGLPVDILLEIFCYCDLFGVLNLSAVRVSQFGVLETLSSLISDLYTTTKSGG